MCKSHWIFVWHYELVGVYYHLSSTENPHFKLNYLLDSPYNFTDLGRSSVLLTFYKAFFNNCKYWYGRADVS